MGRRTVARQTVVRAVLKSALVASVSPLKNPKERCIGRGKMPPSSSGEAIGPEWMQWIFALA